MSHITFLVIAWQCTVLQKSPLPQGRISTSEWWLLWPPVYTLQRLLDVDYKLCLWPNMLPVTQHLRNGITELDHSVLIKEEWRSWWGVRGGFSGQLYFKMKKLFPCFMCFRETCQLVTEKSVLLHCSRVVKGYQTLLSGDTWAPKLSSKNSLGTWVDSRWLLKMGFGFTKHVLPYFDWLDHVNVFLLMSMTLKTWQKNNTVKQ